jgi:hypothetical protein
MLDQFTEFDVGRERKAREEEATVVLSLERNLEVFHI